MLTTVNNRSFFTPQKHKLSNNASHPCFRFRFCVGLYKDYNEETFGDLLTIFLENRSL